MAKDRKKKEVAPLQPEPAVEATPERVEAPLPGWVAPALFGMLTLLLFRSFVFSNGMLLGQDTLTLGYMAREFYAEALRAGDFPLWNPYILGGVPFLEALSGGDSLYPTALLLFFMDPHRALGWKLVLHVFAAGLFMYGWTRSLGVSRGAALVAGTAWLLAPVMVTLVYSGHDGKIFVTTLTPLLFWAMEKTFGPGGRAPLRRRSLLAYAGVAAVIAVVVLSTHFQMAYFLFGAAGAYYAFRCLELTRPPVVEAVAADGGAAPPDLPAPRAWGPAGKRFAVFLAAAIVGASTAGVQLIPAVGYVTSSSRRAATTTEATDAANKEYAASWSLNPEEIGALVIPEFVGNSAGGAAWATDTYWGRNFFKTNHEYVGIVVLLLAGVSFLGASRRGTRLFLAGLGVVALLYALGAHTPVWNLAYAMIPGIRLFRAASMVSFLFSFAAVTLAAFGVDRLRELARGKDPEAARSMIRFLGIAVALLGLGTLAAATGILGDLWTGVLYRGIAPDRLAALDKAEPFIVRGFLIATGLAVLTSVLFVATLKGRLSRAALVGGLVLLVAFDLWRVDAAFIATIDPRVLTQPDPLVTELMRREATEPPFRVHMWLQDQEVRPATFGIPLVGGHHPNDLARYRDLLGMAGSGSAVNLQNPNILDILGVQYLIWPTAQLGGEPQGMEVVARAGYGEGDVDLSLVKYPGLPRARLVGAAEVVPDEAAVARIMEADFDLANTVTLSEAPPVELSGAAQPGAVTWLENGLDRQRFAVTSEGPALLVVADNWYPAWRATVDGVEAPVLRANYTLRAVPVPAGTSGVVMWYDPGVLLPGLLASIAGLLALGAMVWIALAGREARDPEHA